MLALEGALYFKDELSSGKWQKSPDDAESPVSGFSPEKLLSMLRSASRETERLGEEDVRGELTVRYRLTVSCEEAALTDCSGETAPIEVWIDENGLVRRIWFEDGGSTGTLEFFDFGLAVDIQPPPADQVEDSDDLLAPPEL